MNAPAPTSHHPQGPSSWPQWSQCPCWEGTGKDIEDSDAELLAAVEGESTETLTVDDPGAAAKSLGTLQHSALASIYIPDTEARTAAFALLTDKQAEDVRWVATKVNEIAEGLGYQPHELRVERRVTMYKGESFEPLYFGTADVQAGPTIVLDAKFGLVRDYFAQLCGYLLPMLSESGHKMGRAFTVYGRARKVQTYTIDLTTAETVAYSILGKRADPNRRPRLCEYCGMCANRGTCEATTATAAALIDRREDWMLKLPRIHSKDMINDPLAVGAAYYVAKAYMENWTSGLKFLAYSMAERGIVPVGFRKQVEKGRVKVADPGAALELLREAGVTDAALAEINVSMTDLVRAYMKSFEVGETAAKSKVLSILEGKGVLSQGEATFKLVRAKDGEATIRAALSTRNEMKLTQGEPLPLGVGAPQGASE